MEEHPDREPRRAKAVNRGYDDDAYRNEDLERDRIDDERLLNPVNLEICGPVYCSTGYPALIQAPVPPETLRRLENPCFCNKLAAALER